MIFSREPAFQNRIGPAVTLSLLNYPGWILFTVVTAIYLLFTFIASDWIYTDQYLLKMYDGQLPVQSIETLLELRGHYGWVAYLIQPVILLLKIAFVLVCVSIGAILMGVDFRVDSLFRAAVIAESIFILSKILFLVQLLQYPGSVLYGDNSSFVSLSLLSIYGPENVVPWLHYAFQTLNLFEAGYIVAISWLLSREWNPGFVESLNIVFPMYGGGLLLWITFVTFIALQVG